MVLFLFTTCTAFCDNYYWTNGGGDKLWSNPDNWDQGAVPGSSDDVYLQDVGDTVFLDMDEVIHDFNIQGNTVLEFLDGHSLEDLNSTYSLATDTLKPVINLNYGTWYMDQGNSGYDATINAGHGTITNYKNFSADWTFNCDSSTLNLYSVNDFPDQYVFYNLSIFSSTHLYSDITVNGNLTALSGIFTTNGNNIYLKGDMRVRRFANSDWHLVLTGPGKQTLSGNPAYGGIILSHLDINNDNGVALGLSTIINGGISFDPGSQGYSGPSNLYLEGRSLTINSPATVSNADTSNGFIVTNGGAVMMYADSNGMNVPIGASDTNYCPIKVRFDNYAIFVASAQEGITDNNYNPVTDHAVNTVWNVMPMDYVTGFTAKLQWYSRAELNSFDRNNMYINSNLYGTWDGKSSLMSAVGSDPYEATTAPMDVSPGYYSFSISDASLKALPVQLISFTAHNENNKNILNWNTASEINNDHFEVERSTDGKIWNAIGDVQGHGTTNIEESYSFIDASANTLSGNVVYYRLKQVDYNGKFEYSDIRKISTVKSDNFIKVFPNPATNMLNISFSENNTRSISIYSMNGVCVYTSTNENLQKRIDISSFASGMYILKVYSTDDVNQRVFCKE